MTKFQTPRSRVLAWVTRHELGLMHGIAAIIGFLMMRGL